MSEKTDRVLRFKVALTSFLLLLSASFSCSDLPAGSDTVKVTLTFEDASCIEAWLRLKIENATPPHSVALSRDGNTLSTLSILSSDTLLIDEGLSPSTTYTYRASLTLDNNIVVQSSDAPARTLDSTSHDWVFDSPILFGDGGSSVLYDVAIVRADADSPLVYAVGEIYHSDSSQSSTPFGLAIWNGNEWRLKRIYYNGTNIIAPIRGIWVMGPTDIWLAAGSVFHWDGISTQAQLSFSRLTLPDPNATVEKLWGTPSLGLYGVGNAGTIVHYDGTSWTRVESGTSVDLLDVWGTPNGREVWGCGWQNSGGGVILRRANGVLQTIWDEQSPTPPFVYHGLIGTVCVPNNTTVFLSGSGDVFQQSLRNLGIVRQELVDLVNYAYRIRGPAINDLSLAGDFAMLWHWNGLSWNRYTNLANANDRLYGLSAAPTIVVAVGTRYTGTGQSGLIIRGRR